jgi:hypothetical protein
MKLRVLLVVAGILPTVLFSVKAAMEESDSLSNPCVVWGGERPPVLRLQPPCPQRVVFRSQERRSAVAWIFLVPGTMLVASFLGLFGTIRDFPRMRLAAGVALIVISLPLLLGWVGLLPLSSGISILAANSLAQRAVT